MNTLPIELVEQIISNLPVDSLSNICHTNKMLYILFRIELYKRWKECAIKSGELFYEELDINKRFEEDRVSWTEYDELSCCNALKQQATTINQISIMKLMLSNKMIVDPQELEICQYCTSEWNWIGASIIWGFDWEWSPDEYEKEIAWQ